MEVHRRAGGRCAAARDSAASSGRRSAHLPSSYGRADSSSRPLVMRTPRLIGLPAAEAAPRLPITLEAWRLSSSRRVTSSRWLSQARCGPRLPRPGHRRQATLLASPSGIVRRLAPEAGRIGWASGVDRVLRFEEVAPGAMAPPEAVDRRPAEPPTSTQQPPSTATGRG